MKYHQREKPHEKSYKILIDSGLWSCEANLVSCSRIYRYLIENGHELTYDASQADFILINSCGVVKGVIDHCLNLFRTYSSLKKKDATIIMFGCLVKINRDMLTSLDLIPIGPDESNKLDEIFFTTRAFETFSPCCSDETKTLLFHNQKPYSGIEHAPFLFSKPFLFFSKNMRDNYRKYIKNTTQSDRIYVEIGRGCVGDCNYCSIKKAKGNVHSREIDDIISDIKAFNHSSKNIFLVADDCGCYGMDSGKNFIDLMYEINKVNPDRHIDLNNLNPQWITRQEKEYITLFQKIPIDLVKIPIQSGSDKIIKKMNRHYSIKDVLKTIDVIKTKAPGTFIYTHFIIGYPGENTIDFIKTLGALRHFDYALPFQYSKNKGTVSETLPQQKSKMITSLRYFLFFLFLNFVIMIKLFKHPNKIQSIGK
jgi:tRNA A37 methylthiotransferase MiaB